MQHLARFYGAANLPPTQPLGALVDEVVDAAERERRRALVATCVDVTLQRGRDGVSTLEPPLCDACATTRRRSEQQLATHFVSSFVVLHRAPAGAVPTIVDNALVQLVDRTGSAVELASFVAAAADDVAQCASVCHRLLSARRPCALTHFFAPASVRKSRTRGSSAGVLRVGGVASETSGDALKILVFQEVRLRGVALVRVAFADDAVAR